jgi:hypothetical protein
VTGGDYCVLLEPSFRLCDGAAKSKHIEKADVVYATARMEAQRIRRSLFLSALLNVVLCSAA